MSFNGFVANFAQKVMTGQLPLSVRRLSGERVELFGRSEALFPSLNHQLFFPDHVHKFDPNSRVLGGAKRFEPQHGPCHPRHSAMILFHDIVEILPTFRTEPLILETIASLPGFGMAPVGHLSYSAGPNI